MVLETDRAARLGAFKKHGDNCRIPEFIRCYLLEEPTCVKVEDSFVSSSQNVQAIRYNSPSILEDCFNNTNVVKMGKQTQLQSGYHQCRSANMFNKCQIRAITAQISFKLELLLVSLC